MFQRWPETPRGVPRIAVPPPAAAGTRRSPGARVPRPGLCPVAGEGDVAGARLKASSPVLNRPERRPRYKTGVVPAALRTKLNTHPTRPRQKAFSGLGLRHRDPTWRRLLRAAGRRSRFPQKPARFRLKETPAWVNVGRSTLNAFCCETQVIQGRDFSGCRRSCSLANGLGKDPPGLQTYSWSSTHLEGLCLTGS